MGKSESAWKSIKPEQSVLCISYRKTFTEKTISDHNLESYNNISGDITFKQGENRRVVVQVESLKRVRGIPNVIIVDEFHGILRQVFSSTQMKFGQSKHYWDCFSRLITGANRVIVLDADANDDDLTLFRDKLGRSSMESVINTYKPDHDKKFFVEQSHKENYAKLLDYLAPERCQYNGKNKAVIFTHNKQQGHYSVESLAKDLQCRNYRVRYYHADSDPEQKRKDFLDIQNAFNDIDVVIYNLTVEAGISIVNESFKYLAVFSEQIGSVEAIKQAIHRFRNVSEIHYSENPRTCQTLPLNRTDITKAIISKERDLSDVELVFRAPKIEEINSSYGFAYISNIIDENNSRSYFTTRLVASMKNSGYDIIQAIPDEYEIWLTKRSLKKNSKVKIPSKVVNESPNVDEFLKTSIGDRLINAGSQLEESTEDQLPRYYEYDPNEVKSL